MRLSSIYQEGIKMGVEVNYLAVLLAALSSMVVGSIWYAPKVFGNTWMKLAGLTEEKMKKGGMMPMVWAFLLSLLTAYVLAHFTFLAYRFFAESYMYVALSTAFWVWLGFVVTRLMTHNLFEMRPTKLNLLALGTEFVTIMLMGLVIGLFSPGPLPVL
jgi:hypothetical protein